MGGGVLGVPWWFWGWRPDGVLRTRTYAPRSRCAVDSVRGTASPQLAIPARFRLIGAFPQVLPGMKAGTRLGRAGQQRMERAMRKALVSLVFAAALAAPVGWATAASAKPGPDPDANGDVHSNCHTGSKFRGAGGEDNGPGRPKDLSDNDVCAAAPVTPPVQPVVPGAPGAPGAARPAAAAQSAARPAAAQSAARPGAAAVTAPAAPAAAVQGVPRTTG